MAAVRQRLRAVKTGEHAKVSPARKTVAQAAKSGQQRELLVAMRDRIAETLSGDCPPRDLASLSKRLQDIAKDIAALDATVAAQSSTNLNDYDNTFDPAAI
jgi:hypothetical protein